MDSRPGVSVCSHDSSANESFFGKQKTEPSPASAANIFPQVARALTDMRFVELLEENRQLKLELFWTGHNYHYLRHAMVVANQKESGPNCTCVSCNLSGRKDTSLRPPQRDFDCRFKPYFETILKECGIEFAVASHGSLLEGGVPHICMGGTYNVLNVDTHFIMFNGDDWEYFSYGAKLWKGRSVENPELCKLSMLLHKLHEDDTSHSSDIGETDYDLPDETENDHESPWSAESEAY